MQLVQLGSSDKKITRIGLGMAALGRPGYINLGHHGDLQDKDKEAMKQHAHLMLDKAYELGIRYYDAARSYGAAEEFLSSWLSKNGKQCTVGSKWGYTYTANWQIEAEAHEIKKHSVENLKKQWKESQAFLSDHLDLYQIHSAKIESRVLDDEKVLEELWKIQKQGVLIGLSLSGEEQSETLEKALSIKENGKLLFQTVQATFNILEPSAEKMLKQAADLGLGVIIKEAVANGRLTERNTSSAFAEKRGILESLAAKYNVGIDAIALSFVLSKEWVSTVLSGATTPQQLMANVQALEIQLTEKDISVLNDLAETPADYWHQRAGLAWN